MGFDPRRWRPSSGSRPLTTNVEALLAENEALRREVRSLRLQLEVLQQGGEPEPPPAEEPPPAWSRGARSPRTAAWQAEPRRGRGHAAGQEEPRPRVTVGSSHGLSADLVDRWGQTMARHPGWTSLRIGPPGGLRALEEELRRRWWDPSLSLERELDRRCPGLGGELAEALRGPHSRRRWAVRAAFALYGPRATEWLSEAPLRVVDELLGRVALLERRGGPSPGPRGTRTANTSGGEEPFSGASAGWSDPRSERTADSRSRQRTRGTGPSQDGGHGPGDRRRTAGDASSDRGRPGSQRQRSRSSGRGEGEAPGADPRSAGGERRQEPSDPRSRALALLGLGPEASASAIKRAYRRLAKTHHPDLGGDAEAFHRLDAAYRSLL